MLLLIAGIHYERSLKGALLLTECFERLMWSEFSSAIDCIHTESMSTRAALKSAVSVKDRLKGKEHLELFI